MIAKFELRKYNNNEKVWIGKYKNLGSLPHFHHECEILYIESGEADVTIEKNIYHLSSNQSLFVYCREVHSIKASVDSVMIVCLYSEEILNDICSESTLENPLIDYDETHHQLLIQLLDEYKRKLPFYVKKMNDLMSDIIINLFRKYKISKIEKQTNKKVESYKKLLDEVDLHYQDISFEQAAKFMHFSESYFSRYFYQSFGMHFQDYLNHIRIEKAIEIINSNPDKKITDLALEIGFSTIRNFNRLFKKYTGFTPSKLPNDFNYSFRHLKTLENSFDPTESQSILLD